MTTPNDRAKAAAETVPPNYLLAKSILAATLHWQEQRLRVHETDIYQLIENHPETVSAKKAIADSEAALAAVTRERDEAQKQIRLMVEHNSQNVAIRLPCCLMQLLKKDNARLLENTRPDSFHQHQRTECGKCGKWKHTPWRDGAYGYVCAACLVSIHDESVTGMKSALEKCVKDIEFWNNVLEHEWPNFDGQLNHALNQARDALSHTQPIMKTPQYPCCPCCHKTDRVTVSPHPEYGDFFCPCNEPGPQYFNHDGSGTLVTSNDRGQILAVRVDFNGNMHFTSADMEILKDVKKLTPEAQP